MGPLWRVVAVCIAFTVLVAGGVIGFLLWLVGVSIGKVGGVDTVGDLRDVLTIGFGVVAAVGGVIGLVVAYRRQRVAEAGGELAVRAQAHTEFVQAVEQLGSDKAAVRLGGLYALDRLGGSHSEYRQTIVDVICSYLRMPYDLPVREQVDTSGDAGSLEDTRIAEPVGDERAADGNRSEARQELQVRLTAQRLLVSRLRWQAEAEWPADHWTDMTVDLNDATLIDPDFSDCRMSQPQFGGAQFRGRTGFGGAQFGGDAGFGGAQFRGRAEFSGAQFGGDAGFGGAQFSGNAWFKGAQFSGNAFFNGAQFSGNALFSAAQFSGHAGFGEVQFSGNAWFDRAQFSANAGFVGAQFSANAWFSGARFTSSAVFSGAQFSDSAEFDRAQFSVDAWFGGAQFSGNVGFNGTQFSGDVGFGGVLFSGEASFEGGRVRDIGKGQHVPPRGWRVELDPGHLGQGLFRMSSDEDIPSDGEPESLILAGRKETGHTAGAPRV